MPLRYKIDVLRVLKEKGYNTNTIRLQKILSQNTLQRLRKGQYISGESIAVICELLECQPGDILEYEAEPTVYTSKNYIEIEIRIEKGSKELIEEAAKGRGLSLSEYIKEAIKEQYKKDTGLNINL